MQINNRERMPCPTPFTQLKKSFALPQILSRNSTKQKVLLTHSQAQQTCWDAHRFQYKRKVKRKAKNTTIHHIACLRAKHHTFNEKASNGLHIHTKQISAKLMTREKPTIVLMKRLFVENYMQEQDLAYVWFKTLS